MFGEIVDQMFGQAFDQKRAVRFYKYDVRSTGIGKYNVQVHWARQTVKQHCKHLAL